MGKDDLGVFNEQLLLILRGHNVEAELEASWIRAGHWGGHRLAEFRGVFVARNVAGSFSAWAIIMPSGKLYVLSLRDGRQDGIPLVPDLLLALLKGTPARLGQIESGGEEEDTSET